jgi:hypothetical protein
MIYAGFLITVKPLQPQGLEKKPKKGGRVMVQINAKSVDHAVDSLSLLSGEPDFDFLSAKALAQKKARERSRDAMLLSWFNRRTGEFYPRFDCGGQDRPAWIVFAESRGANLTVDVDDGAYVFMFLLL